MTALSITAANVSLVSGPHDTEADCLRMIAEIAPRPAKKK